MRHEKVSQVWMSCEMTRNWGQQEQCKTGELPSKQCRQLRAELILEEALETIEALGFDIVYDVRRNGPQVLEMTRLLYLDNNKVNLEGVIDGCCDLKYVTVGTLVAFNIPDMPHDAAVCSANEAKFINGKPVAHPTIPGKYGKPEGWQPPNHMEIMKGYLGDGGSF